MSNVFPYAVAALAVVGAWISFLVYMDAFTPEDVRAWRRLAALRGFAAPRGRIEKFVLRAGFVRQIQDELDLARQLAIAGKPVTPLSFLGRAVMIGLAVSLALLGVDTLYRQFAGDWFAGAPPILAFAIGAGLVLLSIAALRSEVRKLQSNAGQSLGDMMMLVAIMTDGRGLQLEDAVKLLSRCVDTDALETIVEHRGFQRLVKTPYRNTIELYRLIGEEYRIPAFTMVADAAANANVGFSERETYTRLAQGIYQQRLAESKIKAARAKILVTLPVAGMLIPLLILLGAPAFNSILHGLAAQ